MSEKTTENISVPKEFFEVADIVAPATAEEKEIFFFYERILKVNQTKIRFGRYDFSQDGLDSIGGCLSHLCQEMYTIDAELFADVFGPHHLNLLNPQFVASANFASYGWDKALVESATYKKFRYAQDVSAWRTLYRQVERIALLNGKWSSVEWKAVCFAMALQKSPGEWRDALQELDDPVSMLSELITDWQSRFKKAPEGKKRKKAPEPAEPIESS